MKLIIGLGNPEKKYKNTRHNIGFAFIDFLAQKYALTVFSFDTKSNAQVAHAQINNEKVLLIKPQTFMNLSGKSVKFFTQFYKLSWNDVIIIYDDIDLPFGSLRWREKGGSGGHNGVKSVIAFEGENFGRLKIGIRNEKIAKIPTSAFVLGKFSSEEQKQISKLLTNGEKILLEQFKP